VAKIGSLRPELAFIVATGSDGLEELGMGSSVKAVLHKPFDYAEFAIAIAVALAGKGDQRP
jgi:hypothetical protein